MRFTIGAFENIDVIHGERIPSSLKHFDGGLISPSRPTIADFVRRSSLRRAKAEAVGFEPTSLLRDNGLANRPSTIVARLQI